MTNFTQTIKNFTPANNLDAKISIVRITSLHNIDDILQAKVEGFSHKRKLEWISSRLALRNTLNVLCEEAESEAPSLEINSHHCLAKKPDILVSLAHTEGYGLSFCAFKDTGILSIGADIELINRQVKPQSLKYFKNDQDNLQKKTSLELWTAKEAVFKSLSYYFPQTNLVLKHLWINFETSSADH